MTKLMATFPNFANAHKKSSISFTEYTNDLSITDLLHIIFCMMMMMMMIMMIIIII